MDREKQFEQVKNLLDKIKKVKTIINDCIVLELLDLINEEGLLNQIDLYNKMLNGICNDISGVSFGDEIVYRERVYKVIGLGYHEFDEAPILELKYISKVKKTNFPVCKSIDYNARFIKNNNQ